MSGSSDSITKVPISVQYCNWLLKLVMQVNSYVAFFQIWDLTAAKCLTDFSCHSGAINHVQFHPKELLLAIASSDRYLFLIEIKNEITYSSTNRTISYWDLEDFSFVSVSSPEANPVRRLLFHPSGDVIFSGSHDSLKVHEWEPSNQLDHLPISWGKISDMQISSDQLVSVV